MPVSATDGSLTVVGTGISIAGHLTQEALSVIEHAERLYFLVTNSVTARWLVSMNDSAESLFDSYREGRAREETYDEMVERILDPVRQGKRVVAAFYGHPGVFAGPPHEAVRRARAEGYRATMLPGISAEDCLIADLGIDPGECGLQTFEATDFLIRKKCFDTTAYLVLWQIGVIGVADYRRESIWNREGLVVLAERLSESYPADHRIIVYEASPFPLVQPKVLEIALVDLPIANVTIRSTLCVPPLGTRESDPVIRRRLDMPR